MTNEQLDRLAAEKVMGWSETEDYWILPANRLRLKKYWKPLERWAAAGMVLDKMVSDGYAYASVGGRKSIRASFGKPVVSHGHECATGPRAITVAALLAVGAITEEELNA